MSGFGHDPKRGFSMKERLQFTTDPMTARRVREESKKNDENQGELIERAIKQYFEKVDSEEKFFRIQVSKIPNASDS